MVNKSRRRVMSPRYIRRPRDNARVDRTALRAGTADVTPENARRTRKQDRWLIATAVLTPLVSATVFVVWVLATSRYEACPDPGPITNADALLFALLPTAVTALAELSIRGRGRTLGPVVACIFISAALAAACLLFGIGYCNGNGG
jgi:hypothetical protein